MRICRELPREKEKSVSQDEVSEDTELFLPEGVDKEKKSVPQYRCKRSLWVKRMLLLAGIMFLFICVSSVLKIGLSGKFLDSRIQHFLSEKLGAFVQVEIRNAQLFLDKNFHIALEARDSLIRPAQGDIKVDHIGKIRFGLATRGLLLGKIQVTQIELQDIGVSLPAATENHGIFDFFPHDANGRVDFDSMSDLLFVSLDRLFETFDRQMVHSLILENVSFRFQRNNAEQNLSVAYLRFRNLKPAMTLEGQIAWNGEPMSLEARIDRNATQEGKTFDVTINDIPVRFGTEDNISPYLPDGRINNAHFRMHGLASMHIQGTIIHDDKPQKVAVHFSLTDGHSDVGADRGIATRIELEAAYRMGNGNIEILPSTFVLGGVQIPFKGFVGPLPQGDETTDVAGRYHFELTADNAVSAPRESPEEPLQFRLNLAGRFLAQEQRAVFERFLLQTRYGSLLGQGSLRFSDGSPETIFVLRVPQMPVHEAKQLWPINIARAPRLWVLSHIFGGELLDSTIEIALPGGFFRKGKIPPSLTEREIKIKVYLKNFRSDIIGKIPALREAVGNILIKGTRTEIRLDHGISYVGNDEHLDISEGVIIIPWVPLKPVEADLSVRIRGAVGSVGKLLARDPVNAVSKIPFDIREASGDVSVLFKLNFPVTRSKSKIHWDAWVDFRQFSLAVPWRGTTTISNATGRIRINNQVIELKGEGLLNDIPASLEIRLPTGDDNMERQEKIVFHLDDQVRNRLFPALNGFLTGEISAEIGPETNARRRVIIDLSKAAFEIPWVGWKKGSGIAAKVEMTVASDVSVLKNIEINDFELSGATFQIVGKITVKDGTLIAGDFSRISLNHNDNLRLSVKKNEKIYHIKLTGRYFDVRSLIKRLSGMIGRNGSSERIELAARINKVGGFYKESLTDLKLLYNRDSFGNDNIFIEGATHTKHQVIARIDRWNGGQSIQASSGDAGSVLRFMNFYDKVHGGHLEAELQSIKRGPLSGPVSISDFQIIDEPRLASIVSGSPSGGGKSLNEAVRGRIDVTRVVIDQAFGQVAKGDNYLVLDKGVVRGPTIGATFQGVVYDASGSTTMTGTFMPGYGLNRLFSNVPVLGAVLGNGRDRGLIGITFKVEGNAKKPRVVVNPISVIAPGIFRSIFEFKLP